MERVQELPAMTFLLHRCMSPLAWISDSSIGTVLVYFVRIAQCTALSLYRNTPHQATYKTSPANQKDRTCRKPYKRAAYLVVMGTACSVLENSKNPGLQCWQACPPEVTSYQCLAARPRRSN
jgi:hypothetical protein